MNTLIQIDGAKQTWALENKKTTDDDVPTFEDILPYMGRGFKGEMPRCPRRPVHNRASCGFSKLFDSWFFGIKTLVCRNI